MSVDSGEAKVMAQFTINVKKVKVPVAGCVCTNGVLLKDKLFKLVRDGEVVFEGEFMLAFSKKF